MHTLTRRRFLRNSVLAGAATVSTMYWRSPDVHADDAEPGTVVVVFLRGAMDGLAAVAPVSGAERAHYEAVRPLLQLDPAALHPLGRDLGLHPGFSALIPLVEAGSCGIVMGAGFTDATRSHFEAQDRLEAGMPAGLASSTGWLTRHLQALGVDPRVGSSIAWGGRPKSLSGSRSAINLNRLSAGLGLPVPERALAFLRTAYEQAPESSAQRGGLLTLRSIDHVATLAADASAPTVTYPSTNLGRQLSEIASVVRQDAGLAAATVDVGGWDLHAAAGNHSGGAQYDQFRLLGDALAAFAADLGPERMATTTLVAMTEFGRRVAENGSGGTDHGKASVSFVLGTGVAPSRVHGDWSGLAPDVLDQGDVPVTSDLRDVLGDVLTRRHGARDLDRIFPAHPYASLDLG